LTQWSPSEKLTIRILGDERLTREIGKSRALAAIMDQSLDEIDHSNPLVQALSQS
jgi:hypothetical protein